MTVWGFSSFSLTVPAPRDRHSDQAEGGQYTVLFLAILQVIVISVTLACSYEKNLTFGAKVRRYLST